MILNQKRVIIKEGIFPNDLINKIKITKSCNWFFLISQSQKESKPC